MDGMSDATPDPAAVTLVLVRDLLFSSRIAGVANDLGVPIRVVRDPGKLAGLTGRRLIVDLNQDGAIPAAAAWKTAHPMVPIVGFVSHTDTPTIQSARAAGIDRVLARSQFVAQLPDLLRG